MGIIFALVSAFSFALATLVTKLSLNKNKSPLAVGVIFQFFGALVSAIFFLFEAPQVFNGEAKSWLLMLGACFCWAVGSIFAFKANKVLEISVANLIGQLSVLFSFIVSAIFFRELVTFNKVLGIGLLLLGNGLIIAGSWKHKTVDPEGVKLRILAALTTSIALLLDAANSANFSISLYSFFAYGLGGVIMWIITRVSWNEIKWETTHNWKGQLIMALLSVFGYIMLLKAFALAPKTIVVPLNYMSTIIVVLLGIVILKEKAHLKRKIIAAILAFAGAVLLSI